MGTAPDRDDYPEGKEWFAQHPPKVSVVWPDVIAALIFGFMLVGVPMIVLGLS